MLKFLSLFSGIEAASQAWLPLGWECVAVAEIEKFPCAVLKHHYPYVPNLGDVTKITADQVEALGHIDVVVGGFPCQDLSLAGQRKGLKNADGTITRSGLFFHAVRIADWCSARWTVIENVPGMFSSNEGRDFATVVGELAGCEVGVPGDGWRNTGVALGEKGIVEWCVLDAQWFGLAQRRKRVFIVRDSGDWFNRPPLLFDAQSLYRNSPTSRETRERIAPTLEGRAGRSGANNFATSGDDSETVIPIQEIGKRQSGTSMNGVGHGKPGDPMFTLQSDSEHGVAVASTLRAASSTEKGHSARAGDKDENLVVHSLRADGFDASEDGTGRGTPIIPQVVGCLSDGAHNGGGSTVKTPTAEESFRRTSLCLNAGSMGRLDSESETLIPTLQGGFFKMAVRRLTPRECERLQGFPDDFTLIPFRGKPACDGVRYKALGNSFAVPVVRYIGNKISKAQSC